MRTIHGVPPRRPPRLPAADNPRTRRRAHLKLVVFEPTSRAATQSDFPPADTLRERQIAAARAAGEDRCAFCTGLLLDLPVEPIGGGRLVHAEDCARHLEQFIGGR